MDAATLDRLKDEIPHLRRYARSLTHDVDHADDLVQDVLERGLLRIDRFRKGTNLRSWMFAIMHNMHIDQCRKSRRHGVHVPMEDWMDQVAQPAPQLWSSAFSDFLDGVGRLKKSERAVLLLVGLHGFKHEEAADRLGIAVGTVKSRLFRARAALRDRDIGMLH